MAFHRKDQDDDNDNNNSSNNNIDVFTSAGAPIRYLPLDHLYSTTSPCVSATASSNVMSKKVKARKLNHIADVVNGAAADDDGSDWKQPLTTPFVCKPPIVHVYTRRSKRPCLLVRSSSFYDSLVARTKLSDGVDEDEDEDEDEGESDGSDVGRLLKKKKKKKKRRRRTNLGVGELVKLGVDSNVLSSLDRLRLRDYRNYNSGGNSSGKGLKRKKQSSSENGERVLADLSNTKKWIR